MNILSIIDEVKVISDNPHEFYILAKKYNTCLADFFCVFGAFMDDDCYVQTFLLMYSKIENRNMLRRICDNTILERVKTLNSGKLAKIESLKSAMDEGGYITIYRGENKSSRRYKVALSWTLDKRVAKLFSKRYNAENPVIYMAKVHIDDVIAFIDDTEIEGLNEQEVLVEYKNLRKAKRNKRVFRVITDKAAPGLCAGAGL